MLYIKPNCKNIQIKFRERETKVQKPEEQAENKLKWESQTQTYQ